MQALGYMELKGTGKGWKTTVLVLARQGNNCRYFTLRKSGKKGIHFSDEEMNINSDVDEGDSDKVYKLLNGETLIL